MTAPFGIARADSGTGPRRGTVLAYLLSGRALPEGQRGTPALDATWENTWLKRRALIERGGASRGLQIEGAQTARGKSYGSPDCQHDSVCAVAVGTKPAHHFRRHAHHIQFRRHRIAHLVGGRRNHRAPYVGLIAFSSCRAFCARPPADSRRRPARAARREKGRGTRPQQEFVLPRIDFNDPARSAWR